MPAEGSATGGDLVAYEPSSLARITGALRSLIYDVAIVHVTSIWYEAMLDEVEEGAVVLDVGIGTATALVQHRSLLLKKNIRVIGIDVDEGYIDAAKVHIQNASIENCIRVYHHDVYKMDELKGQIALPHGSQGGFEKHQEQVQFDAIFMSGTFAVLRDPAKVLTTLLKSWTKPDCKIMIAQAYQRSTPRLASLVKFLLYFLTSIDHGALITEREAKALFKKTLSEKCNLTMTSHEIIDDSIDNALEAAYLTILEPKKKTQDLDRIK